MDDFTGEIAAIQNIADELGRTLVVADLAVAARYAGAPEFRARVGRYLGEGQNPPACSCSNPPPRDRATPEEVARYRRLGMRGALAGIGSPPFLTDRSKAAHKALSAAYREGFQSVWALFSSDERDRILENPPRRYRRAPAARPLQPFEDLRALQRRHHDLEAAFDDRPSPELLFELEAIEERIAALRRATPARNPPWGELVGALGRGTVRAGEALAGAVRASARTAWEAASRSPGLILALAGGAIAYEVLAPDDADELAQIQAEKDLWSATLQRLPPAEAAKLLATIGPRYGASSSTLSTVLPWLAVGAAALVAWRVLR